MGNGNWATSTAYSSTIISLYQRVLVWNGIPALAAAGADPELAAIEAGAQDLEPGDEAGTTLFLTDPSDLDLVSRALPAQGFKVLSVKLGYKAKNPVDPASLSQAQLEEVEAFLAAIDDNDDVQQVFVGLAG
jgi:transcriptional/translational regulatory protein YebC/TACO1